MSIELAVLGTNTVVASQTAKIEVLAIQHGLGGFDESYTQQQVWVVPDKKEDLALAGALSLSCIHLKIDGGTLEGARTKPGVKIFILEAMKLPGVYMRCPECSKHRYWDLVLGFQSEDQT